MKKRISSIDEILAALPAAQNDIREEIESRAEAGENIVFADSSGIYDSSGLRVDLTERRKAAITALATKGVKHKSAA